MSSADEKLQRKKLKRTNGGKPQLPHEVREAREDGLGLPDAGDPAVAQLHLGAMSVLVVKAAEEPEGAPRPDQAPLPLLGCVVEGEALSESAFNLERTYESGPIFLFPCEDTPWFGILSTNDRRQMNHAIAITH